ncbi:MAG: SGNH/GDSL hydrolase family protein, partial [Burkholderiaceae bacterium]
CQRNPGAAGRVAHGGFPYDLRVQAGQYLGAAGNVASAGALYVIAGGGNNARAALTAINGGANLAATALATGAAFADDVGAIVDELQSAGAQHIVVWNAPNLGLAPAVAAAGPLAVGAGSFVAQAMNTALAARLSLETGVTTFDLFGFGSMIAADPAAFGFSNVTDACGAVLAANCNQYAYWDGIHPTTAAHSVLANAMAVTLQVPEPQTYALLAIGLVAVALRARRRPKTVFAVV